MAVTLWDYINESMNGSLKETLQQWVDEGIGTPTMAKRLQADGHDLEQRTVWRWIKQYNITRSEQNA